MIRLVLNIPDTSVQIPASAFSSVGVYILVVTPTGRATDRSSNLEVGSAAFAGVGTTFVFWVE